MVGSVRVVLAGLGVCLFVLGVAIVAFGGDAAPGGIWLILTGGVLLIAVVLERRRYRSEASERGDAVVGPGGGEPDVPPPPFQPSGERFIDPTSGRVMRVYVHPATGERRYRAEA